MGEYSVVSLGVDSMADNLEVGHEVFVLLVDEGYPCPEPIDDFKIRAIFLSKKKAEEARAEAIKEWGTRARVERWTIE